ncbi:MAG: hypothetical protein R2724_08935 [Bryobacterales bacterium]
MTLRTAAALPCRGANGHVCSVASHRDGVFGRDDSRPGKPGGLRHGMVALLTLFAAALPSQAALHYVIVQGLPGEPRYEERFSEETSKIAEAARATAGDAKRVHLLKDRGATLEKIAETLTALKNNLNADDTVAVILVGHGSYDGSDYKFNIPGPDLTGSRLASLMDALPAERQLVVNATSSSGASMDALQGKGRIVITATKSGRERNATVFSRYWAESVFEPPRLTRTRTKPSPCRKPINTPTPR